MNAFVQNNSQPEKVGVADAQPADNVANLLANVRIKSRKVLLRKKREKEGEEIEREVSLHWHGRRRDMLAAVSVVLEHEEIEKERSGANGMVEGEEIEKRRDDEG